MNREQKTIQRRAKETAREIKGLKGMKKSERDAEASKALRAAEEEVNRLEIRKTGNGIPEDLICIICERKIRTGDYRIIGYRSDLPIARHEACRPGSVSWQQSAIGQSSRLLKHFQVPPDKDQPTVGTIKTNQ